MTSDKSSLPIWQQPEIIRWNQIIAQSYQRFFGKNLIDSVNTPKELAKALFYAPFFLVSHDSQANPIFNYANQTALQLWSLSWEEFTKTPSAESAEPIAREERAIMLRQATEQGYIENYQGVRISSKGKRFMLKQAKVWNLRDEIGRKCGQAATGYSWEWL